MPFLKDRFETYHSFASATLEEIYSEQKLAESMRLEATFLDSVLLRNDGEGRFRVEPLPLLAQVAPGFGMQFLHANDDPFVDLFVAQNFYTPQRETGRMNGGVGALLLGDAAGNFRHVWPSDSGIVVPQDAKALVAVDLNGDRWQDLVIATNDGPLRTFLRQAAGPSGSPLQIQLRGPVGNKSAAGARIAVTYASGRTEILEVHQGGGYLSQQPPSFSVGAGSEDRALELEVTWPDATRTTVNCEGQTEVTIAYPEAPSTN